jgi:hypothetical protein
VDFSVRRSGNPVLTRDYKNDSKPICRKKYVILKHIIYKNHFGIVPKARLLGTGNFGM